MFRRVVAIGVGGVLLAGLVWLGLRSGVDDVTSVSASSTASSVAASPVVPTVPSVTSSSVVSRDQAVVSDFEGVLATVSEDPSVLAELVAPEMRSAVDLAAAFPEGATIVADADSLVVFGSTAAMLATVTLPSGETDRFLVVFAEIEGEWLLSSTVRVGEG